MLPEAPRPDILKVMNTLELSSIEATGAGIGCATRSIAVSSDPCGGLKPPTPNAPAAVRIVFEADSSQAQR